MSSGIDFLTWMAASDASDAARDAADKAEEAREETARLIRLQEETIHTNKIESLNKMLQDLFYDREVDYYKISSLKNIVHKYSYYNSIVTFSKKSLINKIPIIPTILLLILLVYFFKNNVSVLVSVIILCIGVWSLIIIVKYIRKAIYYSQHKDRFEQERKESIVNLYMLPMNILAREYRMLNETGIVVKYQIDRLVLETFLKLKKVDTEKAKKALLKLYYLLMNLDSNFSKYEESVIVNIFLERPEFKELIQNNRLFCHESLEIYKVALANPKQKSGVNPNIKRGPIPFTINTST